MPDAGCSAFQSGGKELGERFFLFLFFPRDMPNEEDQEVRKLGTRCRVSRASCGTGPCTDGYVGTFGFGACCACYFVRL